MSGLLLSLSQPGGATVPEGTAVFEPGIELDVPAGQRIEVVFVQRTSDRIGAAGTRIGALVRAGLVQCHGRGQFDHTDGRRALGGLAGRLPSGRV